MKSIKSLRHACVLGAVLLTGSLLAQEAEPAPAPAAENQAVPADLAPTAAETGRALGGTSIIPSGSRVYVAPMPGGFENFLIAGFQKKKVPLVVVTDPSKADYEITGIAESEKAGWAKMLFLGSQQSREQASIKVVHRRSGSVVFAYSVHKGDSYRGKQSAGEACAKHIKKIIE